MGDFIGIDGVNAKFVEFSEDMALAAANAARQPNLQHGEIVADPLTTDNWPLTAVSENSKSKTWNLERFKGIIVKVFGGDWLRRE